MSAPLVDLSVHAKAPRAYADELRGLPVKPVPRRKTAA
jgi:hypothetical protein